MRACAYAGVAIPAEVWHAYVDVTRMLAGDFKEEDHPRSDDGKFGSGGGAKDESGPGKGTTHKDFRDSKVVVGDEKFFAKAQAHFSKMFKSELSPDTLRELVGVEGMFEGSEVEYTLKPYGADGIDYTAAVFKDGKEIATIRRQISTSYENGLNGAPVVHHDLMVIAEEYQASGQGTALFSKQVELYQKMGVAMIDTDAAWVGQYQWPRLGYELQESKDLEPIKEDFAKFMKAKGQTDSDVAKALAKVKSLHDLANTTVKSNTVPPELGETKPPVTVKFGKLFLIDRGKREDKSTIPLKFDLRKGSKSVKILDKVIVKKAAK